MALPQLKFLTIIRTHNVPSTITEYPISAPTHLWKEFFTYFVTRKLSKCYYQVYEMPYTLSSCLVHFYRLYKYIDVNNCIQQIFKLCFVMCQQQPAKRHSAYVAHYVQTTKYLSNIYISIIIITITTTNFFISFYRPLQNDNGHVKKNITTEAT